MKPSPHRTSLHRHSTMPFGLWAFCVDIIVMMRCYACFTTTSRRIWHAVPLPACASAWMGVFHKLVNKPGEGTVRYVDRALGQTSPPAGLHISCRFLSESEPEWKHVLTSRRAQSKPEVQAFFGLPDSEELLEKFQCTLVQSYACTNNHFTTPRLVCAAPLNAACTCTLHSTA